MKERVIELTKQGLSKEEIFKVLKSENNIVLAKAADKLTLPQRRRFIKQTQQAIADQALNPFKYDAWTSADQPVQYLKGAKDYIKALDSISQGKEYKSSVSVDVDGTCSGIQIYAMMYRDKSAAHGVNVSPSFVPQDIYGTVAVEMVKIIEQINSGVNPCAKISEFIEKNGRQAFKELSQVFINRKHTKRIVMTLTYGLTNFGILGYSQEAIETIGESNFENPKTAYMAFAKVVTLALDKAADCAVKGMKFTQKIAKYCAGNQIAMQWTTPMGFKAFRGTEKVEEEQIYVRTKARKQVTCDDGSKTFVQTEVVDKMHKFTKTGELSTSKMSSAVAPDLVHSLDASLLMLTVEKAHANGVNKFKLVHDSFGTTAANIPKLNLAIREASVEMSQGNYFKEWAIEVTKSQDWEECKSKVNDWKDEEYISDADVEQGTLDLNSIMESEHIFS
jgi:DNA-directed RNA polymerase